ncbi:RNA-binding (RRM/RBD/RNP motifs) family protein [Actinidia rufa]|uniref:RNA-binding (RRM/RBD/RNP motifs) family protein n=1 Tax=Actinidia rufa TaxID=165716 RepID=A0A7J0H4U5_9ERIC|nr:RNA-binding (RRM/RBD/RNP motifs) family protein [Actinidia rufa]
MGKKRKVRSSEPDSNTIAPESEQSQDLAQIEAEDQLVVLIKEAISKYSDLMESVHKLADADPAHRKIFVHGLGWDANAETLTSEFGKYGEIEDCKVVSDKVSASITSSTILTLPGRRRGDIRLVVEPEPEPDTSWLHRGLQWVSNTPAVAAPALTPALGQALTALLASQGAGLGIGGSYGNQQVMQGGYQNPQMGQGRPPPGAGAYMGHGH